MAIRELEVDGLEQLIRRTYSSGYELQWLREAFKNAIEANAPEIVVGLERANVAKGRYLYSIADNGVGMSAAELEAFITRYGASGKTRGVLTGNFGVGLKSSSLPWNPAGVVVLSVQEGVDTMVWLEQDKSGRFGVRVWDFGNGESGVVARPIGNGFDWRDVLAEAQAGSRPMFGRFDEGRQQWILPNGELAHGTIVVLLGSKNHPHTYFGDPERVEMRGKADGQRSPLADFEYLSRRVWRLPMGVTLRTRHFKDGNPAKWPRCREDLTDETQQVRIVKGSEAGILGADLAPASRPRVEQGVMEIGTSSCPAQLYWFLRDRLPDDSGRRRPGVPAEGYVAALYDDEVYERPDRSTYPRFKQFGVLAPEVRKKLFILVEPQVYDGHSGSVGAHTNDSRSRLLWSSPAGVSRDLPWSDWGEEFERNMPEPIILAIKSEQAAVEPEADLPENVVKRIAARLKDRLRIRRLIAQPDGSSRGRPLDTPQGSPVSRRRVEKPPPPKPRSGGSSGGLAGTTKPLFETMDGEVTGISRHVGIGLPSYEWKPGTWFEASWVFATWNEGDQKVMLNSDHELLREVVQWWQDLIVPSAGEDALLRVVKEEYGASAIARVGQVLANGHLYGDDPSTVKKDMLTDASLTASLMGLLGEEDRIKSRLAGAGWLRRGAML